MGGPGSGNWNRRPKKALSEDYRVINISYLRQEGFLVSGQIKSGNVSWQCQGEEVARLEFSTKTLFYETPSIIFYYYSDAKKIKYSSTVNFCITHPHYGGIRLWFECPRCKRRTGALYLDHSVACRKCYKLAYKSQYESEPLRIITKLKKIQAQLAGNKKTYLFGAPLP